MLDLAPDHAPLRAEIDAAIRQVIDSGQFINGPAVAAFEAAVAEFCECEAAVGVSSGTDALLCALLALEIGPGDEVITTPYTFFATAGAILRAGAKPVFVDIDPATFNLDGRGLEAAITPRTRAIMPVHLFGQPAAMDAVLEVAGRHNLHVIEDAAQAIGARYGSRRVGALGTIGCFSFFPTKNLGGFGEGGMVVTGDPALAERVRALRNHGASERYVHEAVGGNFRLDTIQAAVLAVKLPHLASWTAARHRHAAIYQAHLAGCPQIRLPRIAPGRETVWNQYVIRAERREALRSALSAEGIATAIYYPAPVTEQPALERRLGKLPAMPEARAAAATSLALPVYPGLEPHRVEAVARAILRFYAGCSSS